MVPLAAVVLVAALAICQGECVANFRMYALLLSIAPCLSWSESGTAVALSKRVSSIYICTHIRHLPLLFTAADETAPAGTFGERAPRNVPEGAILRNDKTILDPSTVGDIYS